VRRKGKETTSDRITGKNGPQGGQPRFGRSPSPAGMLMTKKPFPTLWGILISITAFALLPSEINAGNVIEPERKVPFLPAISPGTISHRQKIVLGSTAIAIRAFSPYSSGNPATRLSCDILFTGLVPREKYLQLRFSRKLREAVCKQTLF